MSIFCFGFLSSILNYISRPVEVVNRTQNHHFPNCLFFFLCERNIKSVFFFPFKILIYRFFFFVMFTNHIFISLNMCLAIDEDDDYQLNEPLADSEIKNGQWMGVTVRSQGAGGKVIMKTLIGTVLIIMK
jgi:hypothetical protein